MKNLFQKFVAKLNLEWGFPFYTCLITLVLILLWSFYIAPQLEKIPKDFSYEAKVISEENFYDEKTGDYSGEVSSNAHFKYEVASVENDVLIISNIFDVRTPEGDPIFSVERLYGVNAITGEHVPGYGDQDRTGYLFGPGKLGKESFTYWHVNYNAPATMNFVSEETILGLKTYHFSASYTTDQTENLDYLPGVPEERGISVDTDLSLWLEPETGHLIKYEDKSIAYYYDQETKERIHPWNKFRNEYSSASIATHVEMTQETKLKGDLIKVTPWILGLVASIILGAYLASRKKIGSISNILAYFILVLCLSLTYFVWKEALASEDEHRGFHFETGADLITNTTSDRLDIYAQVLQGGNALFKSSQEVTREEWKAYIEGLNIQRAYPGIQGVGYAIFIKPEDLNSHIDSIRAEGFPNYTVKPEGERDLYTSIIYLEPFTEKNLRAFGYDMWSEPIRRSAMELARDTGEITLSGKVTLVQELETNIQPGFLLYSPIYKNGENTVSIEEKREAIVGYVYSPFRMEDFMSKVLPNEEFDIEYEIYDASNVEEMTEENLMYDSSLDENLNPDFSTIKRMTLMDHNWMIRFNSLPGFRLRGTEEFLADIFLVGGLAASILVFAIVYSFANSWKRASTLAEEITKDLRVEKLGLATTSAKTEAILKSIGEGVIATDKKGKILFVNSAALEMLKLKKNEVIGKDLAKAVKLTNAQGKCLSYQRNPITKILTRKSPVVLTNMNYFYQRKDNTRFPVAITSSPVFLEGKVLGSIQVFHDITKEKEVDKAKTEFVSLASHQLRTPLTTIKWYTEALLKGDYGQLNKHQEEQLEQIYQGNERMVELVNELLTVSRLELGTFQVENKKINIKSCITDLLRDQKPQFTEKQIRLSTDLGKTAINIFADEALLRMVIQNLVSNAVRYTNRNGTVTVSLSTEEDASEILVKVSDTGCGIPKNQQDKIFSKLFRADNAREKVTDGTGLGLYIVKNAVEKLKGKIWFESEENKGSTFFVSIPKGTKF